MNTPRFKNILLIDDNAITNTLHETLMTTSCFAESIFIYESAVDAINYLKNEMKPENIPEIIFLDIRMPVMDGFGFLSEFKKLPASITSKSKIIMLTSSLDESDKAKAKADSHVVDFFVKPLTLITLSLIKI